MKLNKSQTILQLFLHETMFFGPSSPVKPIILSMLKSIIITLEDQMADRERGGGFVGVGWSYLPSTPQEISAIQYLVDNRILSPSEHPGIYAKWLLSNFQQRPKTFLSFRADYERAVAFYSHLHGGRIAHEPSHTSFPGLPKAFFF